MSPFHWYLVWSAVGIGGLVGVSLDGPWWVSAVGSFFVGVALRACYDTGRMA